MPSNLIHGSDGSGSVQNIPANIANGIMDSRNPNLLPNVDPILVRAVGSVDPVSRLQNESIPDFIVDASETPAQATGSVLVGGTETDGDTLTISLNGKATSIVTSGSETLASIATALAAAINANSAVNTNYHAVASTDTVNISALTSGQYSNAMGNATVLTTSTSMGATETLTPTAFSGGAGLLWPQSDFQFSYNGQMFYFLKGRPLAETNDYGLLLALSATGNFASTT
jgi:hypothetical protein